MKFSTAFLDEIRARRARVRRWPARASSCARKGANGAGLSPFNAEKTPSFFVNDQKGFYHDFSSGKHGDIFTFLIETEGLDLSRSGRAARRDGGRAHAGAQRARARSATRSAPACTRFWRSPRRSSNRPCTSPSARRRAAISPIGASTRRRSASSASATPRPTASPLRDALAGRGVDAEQMIEAGLLDPRRGNRRALRPFSRPRDVPDPRPLGPRRRFRRPGAGARRQGQIPQFSGNRAFPQGRPAVQPSSRAQMRPRAGARSSSSRATSTSIAMTQAGFPQTVAPLGTALTAEQCALLWSMASEPILCFDGDKAGHKAAFRAIDTALPLIGAGKSLRFAMLPEGQDPDDLARSGGAQAIGEVLRRAQPLAEMLFHRETEGQRFDTPEKRAGLERRLRELVGVDRRRNPAPPLRRRHGPAPRGVVRAGRAGPGSPVAANASRAAPGACGFVDPGPRVGVAGAALPTPRHLARRPREAPREIAILAILIGHPEPAGAAFRGSRRSRDRRRGARRLSRQAARLARAGLRRGERDGRGARIGGPGGRTRAHLEPRRGDGQLVVPARRGRDLRRRARPSANHGLATKFGGAK